MSINLNDENFEAGNIKVFNGGIAGVVENVTLSVEKKKEDAGEKDPEYKVVFTDKDGAICNLAFWYVTEATEHKSVDKQIQDQGKMMRNLLKATYGADYSIPSFSDAKDMLDTSMKLLREGLKSNPSFRMIANYGSTYSIKKFIQPRSWAPVVESMNVAKSELAVGNIDAMEPLKEDNIQVGNTSTTTTSPSGTSVDDDDWG